MFLIVSNSVYLYISSTYINSGWTDINTSKWFLSDTWTDTSIAELVRSQRQCRGWFKAEELGCSVTFIRLLVLQWTNSTIHCSLSFNLSLYLVITLGLLLQKVTFLALWQCTMGFMEVISWLGMWQCFQDICRKYFAKNIQIWIDRVLTRPQGCEK